jgi:hypothetical protein
MPRVRARATKTVGVMLNVMMLFYLRLMAYRKIKNFIHGELVGFAPF